jgi:integrase
MVRVGDRKRVGWRVVEKDFVWLRAVCRWATDFRDDNDVLLLDQDPTKGLEIPSEKNPARPVATHDRVDAIRAVYHEPRMMRGGAAVETYLPELFEIIVGTGRRVGAVCALRFEDLDLKRTESAPWGAITWPEDTDKMEKEWRCPISGRVRDAVEAAIRKRRRVGNGPLFPDPKNPELSIGYNHARTWLQSAERKAGLEPQKGSSWHAYRRLWASCRKDLPDVDVAQAGGWASLEALKKAYQRPDDATMLKVVTHETELREVR